MLLNLQFNGAGIHHDGGGFSTDISETCHWLTPFVLEPEDGMDVWYVSEGSRGIKRKKRGQKLLQN